MARAEVILICLSVFYFLENVDRYLIGVARVPYIDYHSLEYSILAGPAFTVIYSLVGLIIALTYQESMHIFNAKIDKLTLLSVVALVFSGSFLLTAVASQFWQLFLIRVTMGAALSMITPFSSSIITERFASATRGAAFGIFNSATYVAFSFTLSVGTYVYNHFGWRAGYLLFGTISTALALPLPCYKAIKLVIRTRTISGPYASVGTESQHGEVELIATKSPLGTTNEGEMELREEEDSILPNTLFSAPPAGSLIHMYQSVKILLCHFWWEHPYIYTAALATGARLGAGYIWSNYTSLFFSPLFLAQTSGDLAGHSVSCTYSYSNQEEMDAYSVLLSKSSDVLNDVGSACGEAYPYCVNGACKALTSSPWHNKGMSGDRLAQFMWWVPLVGSALGNVLGGLLSDRAVMQTAEANPANNKTSASMTGDTDSSNVTGASESENSPSAEEMLSQDGGGAHIESGLCAGGHPPQGRNHAACTADTRNSNDNSAAHGGVSSNSSSAVRFLVCSLGNLFALPFVCGAVLLDYPYCFLVQTFSGLLAEMYLGQTLVVVSDTALTGVPKSLCAPAVALFMLLVTLLGGNIPLLLPSIEHLWGYTEITIHFTAAPTVASSVNATSDYAAGEETFQVLNPDARRLQCSMLTLFVLCYGLSALFYFCAFLQLKRKTAKPGKYVPDGDASEPSVNPTSAVHHQNNWQDSQKCLSSISLDWTLMTALETQFFVSAIVWVPYSVLLFYLFSEHYTRSRNLQSKILFLFACGSVFRCVWFFVDNKIYYVTTEVINRTALLLQFSGLSLLLLMWSRAIAISKMTDTAFQESGGTSNIESGRDEPRADSFVHKLHKYQEATQAVMLKLANMNSFLHYLIFAFVVNVMVWGFVMGTLADNSYLLYNINIIGISIACFVVAVGTLGVGLWVSTSLHVALSPVYIANSSANYTYEKEEVPKYACLGRFGAKVEYALGMCGLCSLYAFIFNYNQSDNRQGLQMQREVLKVILSVSTITSFFFLIRSFCFMYRPVIEEHITTDPDTFGNITYPFFFYQVPEMVPNLVIALGISPPGGVLRKVFRTVLYGYRVLIRFVCCGQRGSSNRLLNPQRSVFDSECASMSPMQRPSYLPEVLAAKNAQELKDKDKENKRDIETNKAVKVTTGAPTPSSAPIVIPVTRRGTKGKIEVSVASETTAKNAQTGAVDIEAPAAKGNTNDAPSSSSSSPRPPQQSSAYNDVDSITSMQDTLSPVHSKASSLMEESSVDTSEGPHSMYSRETGSMGAMSSFQVESSEGEGTGGGRRSTRGGGSNNFVSYVGRSLTSLRTSLSGSSHGPNSQQGRSLSSARLTRRMSSRRGSNGLFEDEDEEDEWTRERRNSAEIAEMLYRFNSFSTADLPSGHNTVSSSLTSGYGLSNPNSSANSQDSSRNVSLQSVDSNTINNSRRHFITDIIGGNRSLPASVAGTPAEGARRGWFN